MIKKSNNCMQHVDTSKYKRIFINDMKISFYFLRQNTNELIAIYSSYIIENRVTSPSKEKNLEEHVNNEGILILTMDKKKEDDISGNNEPQTSYLC